MHSSERFLQHGRLKVSGGGTHLVHADGTPFFYLADTAWNGALLSTDADWERYLDDRVAKGFTAIQFITHAPWTAAMTNLEGQTAFDGNKVNPSFFDRIDRRMEAINARGLLAVPVLAWAANFGASNRLNIGHTASAEELIPIVRYQVERLARFPVLWLLAGDGVYNFWRVRKWKKVGRAVFGEGSEQTLVAMHPAGMTWPYKWMGGEYWLNVFGYQSSHSEDRWALQWLQSGPPARTWKWKARPTINMEPVYEDIAPVRNRPAFGREAVRRAVCWSLLNAPTAGVAYGAHGLWGWHDRAMEAMNHKGLGVGQPWDTAMNLPGSSDVGRIGELFRSIDWWALRPDLKLIRSRQTLDAAKYVAASRSEDGKLAVIYVPGQIEIEVEMGRLAEAVRGFWFSPATGERREAAGAAGKFVPPGEGDFLLVLECK